MRIIRTEDYSRMSEAAARHVAAQVTLKPDSVLGLLTGSTPLGMYGELIRRHQAGVLDLSRVRTVNLDEYEGLAPSHPQSYARFMYSSFFDHVNVPAGNIHIPSGTAPVPLEECARYDRVIQNLGGIDLMVLGIGCNGHIGFNEPGDAFFPGTRLAELAPSTREANCRFFSSLEEVPRRAFTMGIRDIFQARRVLLLASGRAKAEAVREAFTGPVTPRVPASILQLHRDFTLAADEEALSLL